MIDHSAFTRLCHVDQLAVCAVLQLPAPTTTMPLDLLLIQQKVEPSDALARLEQAKDLRALIAAACLNGKLTKCPEDPQLKPKPYPKPVTRSQAGNPVAPESATSQLARKRASSHAARVLVSHIPNPKKPGSAARDRYWLYEDGLTDAQLLAKGLRPTDLRHDTERHHLVWRNA